MDNIFKVSFEESIIILFLCVFMNISTVYIEYNI